MKTGNDMRCSCMGTYPMDAKGDYDDISHAEPGYSNVINRK